MSRPPARWLDTELPQGLSTALSSADADAQDAALARVRARLEAQLGQAFEGEPPGAAGTKGLVRELVRAQWPVLGAIAVLGLSAFWLRGPDGSVGAARSGGVQLRAAERAAAPAVQKLDPSPLLAASALLPPAIAPTPEPLASLTMSRDEPPRAAARVAKRPAPAALGLAEELRQLNQIKQQLTSAPGRALVAADAHAQRFPHGTLGPERELLRVDALLRLGRGGEAHTLAEHMLATPEGYPYRTQLSKLLAKR